MVEVLSDRCARLDGEPIRFEVRPRVGEELPVIVGDLEFQASIGYDTLWSVDVSADGVERRIRIVPPPPLPRGAHAAAEGATAVTAPLAGTIASVRVAVGDAVEAGDLLVTLDAMKMEHRITATAAGTVAALLVGLGEVVREGDVLVELA
jgi:acetyl/propionyl-CoA carboxylase alpha subunit